MIYLSWSHRESPSLQFIGSQAWQRLRHDREWHLPERRDRAILAERRCERASILDKRARRVSVADVSVFNNYANLYQLNEYSFIQ